MNKVFGIKEKDFFQFIKKINEFYATHHATFTQTHYAENTWNAVIWFDSAEDYTNKPQKASPEPQNKPQQASEQGKHHNQGKDSPEPPTPRQLESLTKNQDYLKSKGIDIKEIKTKHEAFEILQSLFAGEI